MGRTSGGSSGSGAVSSVFGRTGAVVAESGDYTAAEVGALPSTTTYAPGTTVTSYITEAVDVSASTLTNITSVSLSAGTWLVTGRCVYVTSVASVAVAAVALGPSSASTSGAYAESLGATGAVAGGDQDLPLAVTTSVVLTSTTTVYFMVYCTDAGNVNAESGTLEVGNMAGIVAVRTA